MHYEFYIDVYVFTNFFFDYLVLLLTREIRNRQAGYLRIALAAILGVMGSTMLMLWLKNTGIYKLLVHLLINPLMLFGCFKQKNIREFLKDDATAYLLLMLVGGCMQWLCQMTGKKPLFGWGVAALSVVLTLFLCLYQNRREEEKIYDIRICQGGEELSTKGFLDTGNLLMDPYVNLPVSLIGADVLEKLNASEGLAYRYIPFVSLGEEHGLVKAATLEALCIRRGKEEMTIKPAVFAVVEEAFLKGNEYGVILNGRLW